MSDLAANARYRKWYAANRETISAKKQAWKEANRERVRDIAGRYRTRHAETLRAQDRVRNSSDARLDSVLFAKYGVRIEEYRAQLEVQQGVCAICKSPPRARRRLCVDHCHETGILRGLLCDPCNHGLGMFRDDPERLQGAIGYLEAAGVWSKS